MTVCFDLTADRHERRLKLTKDDEAHNDATPEGTDNAEPFDRGEHNGDKDNEDDGNIISAMDQ